MGNKRTRKLQKRITGLRTKLKETVKQLQQYKKFDEHSHHYLGSEKSSSSLLEKEQNLEGFSPIKPNPEEGTFTVKEFDVNELSPISSVSISPSLHLYTDILAILDTNGMSDSDKIARIKELFKRDNNLNISSINNNTDNQLNMSNDKLNTSINGSFVGNNSNNKLSTSNNESFFGNNSKIYHDSSFIHA
jgi:hypothetical protein